MKYNVEIADHFLDKTVIMKEFLKVLGRIWEKKTVLYIIDNHENQHCQVEDSMKIPQKTKHLCIIKSSSQRSVYLAKEMKSQYRNNICTISSKHYSPSCFMHKAGQIVIFPLRDHFEKRKKENVNYEYISRRPANPYCSIYTQKRDAN